MALKKLKPNTPATRYYTISSFDEITKTEPEKSLTKPLKKLSNLILMFYLA